MEVGRSFRVSVVQPPTQNRVSVKSDQAAQSLIQAGLKNLQGHRLGNVSNLFQCLTNFREKGFSLYPDWTSLVSIYLSSSYHTLLWTTQLSLPDDLLAGTEGLLLGCPEAISSAWTRPTPSTSPSRMSASATLVSFHWTLFSWSMFSLQSGPQN